MKNKLFFLAMFLFGALIITSCNKEDDDPVVIDNPVYGFQIKGAATGDKVLTIDVPQMVEPSGDFATKTVREGMTYGIHYLMAGDFAFKNVTIDGETTYGVSASNEVTQSQETGEDFKFTRGTLETGGTTAFTIAEAGLYYIMADMTSSNFWVMKINNIEIHTTGDKLDLTSVTADGGMLTFNEINVRSSFKLRLNTGWKIIADDIPYLGEGHDGDGIRPVISYGGTLAALAADGGDIDVSPIEGHYTNFEFTLDLSKRGVAVFSATSSDGGEKIPTDYSVWNMGLIGNGIIDQTTNAPWGWDNSYEDRTPTNVDLIYTWSWENVLVEANDAVADEVSSFKFRKDNDWAFALGFADVTMGGGASANFFSGSDDGNFGVAARKAYDFELIVDATTDKWTLKANEHGAAPKLFMTGAALGGWDWDTNFVELAWVSGSKFEATTDFAVEAFRFFGQQGWDGDSYNYPYFTTVDANFENAADGDQNLKFIGTPGSYKITVDLDAKTVELVSAK